jgi:hypothetical protein
MVEFKGAVNESEENIVLDLYGRRKKLCARGLEETTAQGCDGINRSRHMLGDQLCG